MFHLMGYTITAASSGSTNLDMAALNDNVYSQRNLHYIFSEPYNLLGVRAGSPLLTDARLNMPSVNAVGFHHVWPIENPTTLQIASPPRIQDLRSTPFNIPDNEEMAWLASTAVTSAGEQVELAQWIAPPDWNQNLTRGIQRLVLKATAIITTVQDQWSGLFNIAFEQTPRGGWYSVNAAYAYNTNADRGVAFRLFFPRNPMVSGRIMRPGHLLTGQIGDQSPYQLPADQLGEWGKFHTFEPPMMEVWSVGSGTVTFGLRLDVTYLGTNPSYTIGQNV